MTNRKVDNILSILAVSFVVTGILWLYGCFDKTPDKNGNQVGSVRDAYFDELTSKAKYKPDYSILLMANSNYANGIICVSVSYSNNIDTVEARQLLAEITKWVKIAYPSNSYLTAIYLDDNVIDKPSIISPP